ncbi:hypothetical protein RUM43_000990 [Polyplax serrata]|uniref:Uncharacterized protein n=1 Tax=Polyplax serrata TaxID=468196 RepID=A0AAN8SFI8_POLSC
MVRDVAEEDLYLDKTYTFHRGTPSKYFKSITPGLAGTWAPSVSQDTTAQQKQTNSLEDHNKALAEHYKACTDEKLMKDERTEYSNLTVQIWTSPNGDFTVRVVAQSQILAGDRSECGHLHQTVPDAPGKLIYFHRESVKSNNLVKSKPKGRSYCTDKRKKKYEDKGHSSRTRGWQKKDPAEEEGSSQQWGHLGT